VEDMVADRENGSVDGRRSIVISNAEQYSPARVQLHGGGELGI
jgi:hypothetical protein